MTTKMFEFYYVPIGICNDIIRYMSLVAYIDAVYYQRTDGYQRALINDIDEDTEVIHIIISASIEDSLVEGFEAFLLQYIDDMRSNIKTLNKIYSEVQSDNS